MLHLVMALTRWAAMTCMRWHGTLWRIDIKFLQMQGKAHRSPPNINAGRLHPLQERQTLI